MLERITNITRQEFKGSKVLLHSGPFACGKSRNILVNAAAIWIQSPKPLKIYMIDPFLDLKTHLTMNVDNLSDEFRDTVKDITIGSIHEIPVTLKGSILLIDQGAGYNPLFRDECFGYTRTMPDWILCSMHAR